MEKIPYLIDLGINQIELMPVYEFVDAIAQRDDFKADKLSPQYKCNYWGIRSKTDISVSKMPRHIHPMHQKS